MPQLRKMLGTINVERTDANVDNLEPWQKELKDYERAAIRRHFEQRRPAEAVIVVESPVIFESPQRESDLNRVGRTRNDGQDFLARAQRRLDQGHPMNVREVMALTGLGRSAAYDHKNLERVSNGKRRWLVTAQSVRKLLDSYPE